MKEENQSFYTLLIVIAVSLLLLFLVFNAIGSMFSTPDYTESYETCYRYLEYEIGTTENFNITHLNYANTQRCRMTNGTDTWYCNHENYSECPVSGCIQY